MFKKMILVFCFLAALALQGTVFAGNSSGPNGAGPNVRDPAYYRAMDKIFLGTWECTNDINSKLTIKEANPQTGGYYVDFFFYRLAHADGYANMSGDKLSINQGSVNDDQNFRGIFERTHNGIRFTVTESGFNYLKPGEVFEYKKMNGKPAVADSDIIGSWSLRSWANATIVCYEFSEGNYWAAYAPQWVVPGPKPKPDKEGPLYKVAAGFYKVQHEGNYDPTFKLFEADGKFYAYVSIENDAEAGCKALSINGKKTYFYNEKAN